MVNSTNQEQLFTDFIREKTFLQGCSSATIRSYSESWLAFKRFNGEISASGVKQFMISMISSGTIKPSSANSYARGINAWLTWLFENQHSTEKLKVPLTATEKRVMRTYSIDEVSRIVSYKPKTKAEKRLMGILFALIDTGARVSEILSLTRKSIDFDNLLVTLKGKGSKERKVPVSVECAKSLFRFLQTHSHDIVFCSANGKQMRYDNLRRDFVKLLDWIGVERSEGSFHAFRRFFSREYLRSTNSNVLYLQKLLGHASLELIRKHYLDPAIEDLSLVHKSASPLERLKR